MLVCLVVLVCFVVRLKTVSTFFLRSRTVHLPRAASRRGVVCPLAARLFARLVACGLAACVLAVCWAPAGAAPAHAQKVGFVDSAFILDNLPAYATVQQQIGRLEEQWEAEIEEQRQAVEEMRREFQARELLYTDEERRQRRTAIGEAERELQQLRTRYFGPDGELYTRQEELMRPIQERILAAVEEVATAEGYDYVLDKSGDYLFLFARDQYDLSTEVLRELGVDLDDPDAQQQR